MTRERRRTPEGSSRMRMRSDRPSARLRKGFVLTLLALIALLCPSLAGVASASVHVWTISGPEGGDVRALAVSPANPATLYAGRTAAASSRARTTEGVGAPPA